MIYFSNEHLWIRISEDGASAEAGITPHAQDTLGEIVFVELPALGNFERNQAVGLVESAKTASDLFMPVTAKIVAVNEALRSQPDLLNNDPMGAGWIFRIAGFSAADCSALMDEAAYGAFAA